MEPIMAVIATEIAGAVQACRARTRTLVGDCKRTAAAIVETETACSDDLLHRLHIDVKGFQKLRGHDVEADRELQFDQRSRGKFRGNRLERRVGGSTKRDDLVGEGKRRPLHLVEAGRGLPVAKRGVLL